MRNGNSRWVNVVPIVGRLRVNSKSWSGENHQTKEQVEYWQVCRSKTFLMAQNKKNGHLFVLVAVYGSKDQRWFI